MKIYELLIKLRDIDNDIDLSVSQVVPIIEYHKPISDFDKKKINELKVLRKDLKLLSQINNLEEKRSLIRTLEIKIKNLENHLGNKGKLISYIFM
jgi:hypothetical protein